MEGNRHTAGSSLVNAVICLVMVGIVVAVVLPTFRCSCPHHGYSNCQSNMKQIGNAIRMYLSDWQDTYPTNRAYTRRHKLGPVADYVKLSDPRRANQAEPRRFQHGSNWVEGLYHYVESVTKSTDPASVWCCQAASPRDSDRAATTYVFNRNLTEESEGIIRSAVNLMLIREVGGTVNSELRPTNDSTANPNRSPICPFLTGSDPHIGDTNPKLHGNGSHILFADGHVRRYDTTFFPPQSRITKANCWDPNTEQWYNYYYANPKSPDQKAMNMSIAITP